MLTSVALLCCYVAIEEAPAWRDVGMGKQLTGHLPSATNIPNVLYAIGGLLAVWSAIVEML